MAKKLQRETAVLVRSDVHYGKRTPSYNPNIYRKRMAHLGESLAQIRSLLSGGYDIRRLVIFELGDANDGTGIYPTQEHHQAITNVERQAEELATYDAAWYKEQAKVWGAVEVEAVPGNHGRAGRFAHEAASWDLVYFQYLRLMLRGAVDVRFEREGDPFLRIVELWGHRYLLYHGHAIRMWSGIPWYGIQIRVTRWATTGLAPLSACCFGHFHYYGEMPVNRTKALLTGTMVSSDEWALQTMGYEAQNTWHLFGVGKSRPMTWHFGVDLTDGGRV
ncbi:MAG: hypothetical protein ACE5HE_08855 [Phycisphaerae bacterium]